MEELLEMISWSQLGIHDKPVCLLPSLYLLMKSLVMNVCYYKHY